MLEGDCTARSTSEFKNYLTVNHGLHDVTKKFGIQIIESVLVICYLRSDFRQTANKARYDATVCKNVRILIFGASGSAANVLRAPGSTVK